MSHRTLEAANLIVTVIAGGFVALKLWRARRKRP